MKQKHLSREQIQQRQRDKSKQIYFSPIKNTWRVYFPREGKPDCREINYECEFMDFCELLLPCDREATQKEVVQHLRFIKQWEKTNPIDY